MEMTDDIQVERWSENQPATEEVLRDLFDAEGLHPYRWSNAPGDVYAAHAHGYHKVIYVVRGSIAFGLPGQGEKITLHPGDRLDLPPGVVHDAVVGPEGVACLEAHRS
jgi:quercetin dioxygenase-like cupin family protein